MASGFTWGHMIRKRMGLPPLFLLPSYFPPVFPLFEQSPRNQTVHTMNSLWYTDQEEFACTNAPGDALTCFLRAEQLRDCPVYALWLIITGGLHRFHNTEGRGT